MKTSEIMLSTKKMFGNLVLLIVVFSQTARSQTWSNLAGGMNDWVYATTVYNGELIAGGAFTGAGGVFANHVARWNGTSWDSLGSGLDGDVWALTVYNNELWAGGQFFNAGGIPVSYIAKWNGSAWSDPEGGMDGRVVALTVYNGNLIAGGYFTTANVSANYIAQWDGHSWSPLGSGMSGALGGQVMALNVYGLDLITAGFFTNAGGVSANHIAKWNGTAWDSVGSGINWIVYALTVYNSDLIAGGLFASAGGVAAHSIAKWNGTLWDSLGSGIGPTMVGYDYVLALTVYNGNLFAGGLYLTAGGVTANGIAKWNGNSWSDLAGGVYYGGSNAYGVYALTVYGNDLIAGGLFTSAGSVGVAHIAKWSEPTSAIITVEEIPVALKLFPNYPNPFNPSTKIKFSLVRSSFTKITIYDIYGREVTTLVNKRLQPGTYDVEWNAANYTSGVYFYRIVSGDIVQTKKMVLLR